MRILTILITTQLMIYSSFGQIIHNNNFQDFSFSGGICYPNLAIDQSGSYAPFQQSGCNNKGSWYVSHGTPEVFQDGVGNNLLCLWATGSDDLSEGVFLYCDFNKNDLYTLRFTIKSYNRPVKSLKVILVKANQLQHMDLIDGMLEFPVPVNKYTAPFINDYQIIKEITNIPAQNSSLTVSLSFVPSDHSYKYIIIYPTSEVSHRQYVYLDNFQFLDCEPFAEYYETNLVKAATQVRDYIMVGGNVVLTNGNEYIFEAGNFIDIISDFSIHLGTSMEAQIQKCGFNENDCGTNDFYPFKSEENFYLSAIFPNPAISMFCLKESTYTVKSIQVVSIQGAVLIEENFENHSDSEKCIDFYLPSGSYIVSIITNENRLIYEKLFVR